MRKSTTGAHIQMPSIYTKKDSPYSSHERILNMISEKGTAVDFGSANGILTGPLRSRGVLSTGVDLLPSDQASKELSRYIQFDLDKVHDLKLDQKFDYVIMADVIEHLKKSESIVAYTKSILNPSGTLILSVPNIALWICRLSLLLGHFNYTDKGPMDRTHLRFFTIRTISKLLIDQGFEIQKIDFSNLPFEVVLAGKLPSIYIKAIDAFYRFLVLLRPTLFSYQIIIQAKPKENF